MRKQFILAFLIILYIPFAKASKIEKAYKALKVYDYFKAKCLFERTYKRHTSPASYGLAIIYYRKDNPFHNIDSAFRYILIADSSFTLLDEKRKLYYSAVSEDFDYINITLLKIKISTELFHRTAKQHTIVAYDKFLKEHPWSNEYYTAVHRRDSIAFFDAMALNTSSSLDKFMQAYPYSEFFNRAKKRFEDLRYIEWTKHGLLASYLEYLTKFPGSFHEKDAEDQVFRIVTESNTIESFYAFVKNYPRNRNVGLAWRKIYQLFMSEFSENRLDEFRRAFPQYPYVEELEVDIKNFSLQLLPFNRGERYGFMDYSGKVLIYPQYEQVGFFSEGLAMVMKDGKYGFIDKGNKLIVPCRYSSVTDFEKGRSLVEMDGKFGMIDRSGKLIFPVHFEDLGILSDGLAYGKKDSLYGYYDALGNLRVPEQFEEAFSFSDSLAKVQLNGYQAYIDIYGTNIIAPAYQTIDFFSDSLLIFKENEKFGLMKRNFEIVVHAQYDRIFKPVIDRTMVIMKGKIGYIDLSGNMIIPAQYETFPNSEAKGQFTSNLTVVKFKGKFGVIDKNGRFVLQPTFSAIGDVSSLMAFSKGKGWGYVDLLGKVLIQPQYSYAESFLSGTAIVEKDGCQGLIDVKGKLIVPVIYKTISRLNKDYFLAFNGAKFGLYSVKGELLLPFEYESIRAFDKELFMLIKDGQLHYFYVKELRRIESLKE